MILKVLVLGAFFGCGGNDDPARWEAREPVADVPTATPSTQVVREGSGMSTATEAPTTYAPGPDATTSDARKDSALTAEPGEETPQIIEEPAEPTPGDRARLPGRPSRGPLISARTPSERADTANHVRSAISRGGAP